MRQSVPEIIQFTPDVLKIWATIEQCCSTFLDHPVNACYLLLISHDYRQNMKRKQLSELQHQLQQLDTEENKAAKSLQKQRQKLVCDHVNVYHVTQDCFQCCGNYNQ